jgi:hypothetical protein
MDVHLKGISKACQMLIIARRYQRRIREAFGTQAFKVIMSRIVHQHHVKQDSFSKGEVRAHLTIGSSKLASCTLFSQFAGDPPWYTKSQTLNLKP